VSAESLARMKALGIGWAMQDAMYSSATGCAPPREAVSAAHAADHDGSARRGGSRVRGPTHTAWRPTTLHRTAVDARWQHRRRQQHPGAEETPSRELALRLYTLNSAWFSFDEDKRGSLEVGKLADFAILDQDFFTIPSNASGRTVSLFTGCRRPCRPCFRPRFRS
jgi:predicted amidohydrolase YtcJ